MIDELDYEHKKQYDLTVAATDSVSGVQSETLVRISIQDVNDCPPEFSKDSYNISLPETSPIGTMVLKVIARDNDTGIYSLSYSVLCFKSSPKDNNSNLHQNLLV